MMRRHTELIERSKVDGGWIPHIRFPAVPGVAQGKLGHELVTKNFCNDRGAGDRVDRLITANHRRVRPDEFAELARRASIDERKVGRRSPSSGKLRNSTRHCAM